MTELGGGVDELEVDLLQGAAVGLHQQRLEEETGFSCRTNITRRGRPHAAALCSHLTQGQDPLLGSHDAALHHDEVVSHLSVVDEPTLLGTSKRKSQVFCFQVEPAHGAHMDATHQRVDAFVGQVVLCGGVVLHQLAVLGVVALTDLVDLLVDLGAVVVALLTGTGHRERDAGRMPGADTGHLTQSTMGFARKLLRVPAAGDTCEEETVQPSGSRGVTTPPVPYPTLTLVSVSLCDTNDIDHLVLTEDRGDGDGLLQPLAGPVHLVRDGAAVQLDLHEVRLLLSDRQQTHLHGHKHRPDQKIPRMQFEREGASAASSQKEGSMEDILMCLGRRAGRKIRGLITDRRSGKRPAECSPVCGR